MPAKMNRAAMPAQTQSLHNQVMSAQHELRWMMAPRCKLAKFLLGAEEQQSIAEGETGEWMLQWQQKIRATQEGEHGRQKNGERGAMPKEELLRYVEGAVYGAWQAKDACEAAQIPENPKTEFCQK
jgi:hypothetical protein